MRDPYQRSSWTSWKVGKVAWDTGMCVLKGKTMGRTWLSEGPVESWPALHVCVCVCVRVKVCTGVGVWPRGSYVQVPESGSLSLREKKKS